eukprot:4207742-Pyramimonas_sp.AAC.1
MRVRLLGKTSAKDEIAQGAAGTVRGVKFHPDEFPTQDARADWCRNQDYEAHGRGGYRCSKLPRCLSSSLTASRKMSVGSSEKGVVQISARSATWQLSSLTTRSAACESFAMSRLRG